MTLSRYNRAIVDSVVTTVLPSIDSPHTWEAGSAEFARDFVAAQIERMPVHLRTAMIGLATAFDVGAIARFGRPFHKLDPERRQSYLASWKRSNVATFRDFVRFHRSLAVFALYSAQVPKA